MKKNLKFTDNPVQVLILLLLSLCIVFYFKIFFILFYSDDLSVQFNLVYELASTLYDLFLFLGLYFIFKEKLNAFAITLLLLLSITTGFTLFFEEIMIHFLRNSELIEGYTNPQTPRTLLFIFTGLCLLIKAVIQKKGRFNKLIIFSGMVVVMTTSTLYHTYIIEETIADFADLYKKKLDVITKAESKEDFVFLCKLFDYECFTTENNSVSVKDKRGFNQAIFNKHINKRAGGQSFVGLKTYGTVMYNYVGMSYGRYVAYLVGDFHIMKRRQIVIFYKLSIIAHTVWSLICFLILWLHRKIQGDIL